MRMNVLSKMAVLLNKPPRAMKLQVLLILIIVIRLKHNIATSSKYAQTIAGKPNDDLSNNHAVESSHPLQKENKYQEVEYISRGSLGSGTANASQFLLPPSE